MMEMIIGSGMTMIVENGENHTLQLHDIVKMKQMQDREAHKKKIMKTAYMIFKWSVNYVPCLISTFDSNCNFNEREKCSFA